jgi:uncharacterized LabA/DUF88 family protein
MKIGLFVDVSNLYYSLSHKHGGRKLDYTKYLQFVKDIGTVERAVAYGAQMNNEAISFVKALKMIGFETKFKKPKEIGSGIKYKRKADWDVGMTMDILLMLPKVDAIVLGSADSDMAPVCDEALRQGKRVIVFACGVASELHTSSTQVVEIYEGLLEETKHAASN